jgi:hypothetical protein
MHHVVKAHGNLLSDYATNYNAVLRYFNAQRYPRWSSLLPTELNSTLVFL